MPKDYTANKIENFFIRIKLSTPSDPVIDADNKYRIALLKIQGIAKNNSNFKVSKSIEQFYGSPQDVPYTAKEVGDVIKNFSNLNTVIYNDIKQLYLDLLNEDIT